MPLRPRELLVILAALLAAACGHDSSGPAPSTSDEARAVVETYADILHAAYDDALDGATDLDAALRAMTSSPSVATLEAAREAWIASRPAYLQTEVARFYGGPIDHPESGPEMLVNAWPLDEAYIDYVRGGDGEPIHGGIVNDESILAEIDAEGIAALNQADSEENVSTGYHAIEFLLWGQDLRADGAGERSHEDYVAGGTAMNVERRRAYLEAVSTLLVGHLREIRDEWAPDADNYRARMLASAVDPREPLRRILVGMASLSGAELAGERMNVAYTTREQEDEHSCFSDTTHVDHLYDAIGIQNVYLGRYARTDGTIVEGPSLSALVAARDPELDARMRTELEASIAAIRAIPTPFDQAIAGAEDGPGRTAIRAAIAALRAQTRTLVEVAALFDIRLNVEE